MKKSVNKCLKVRPHARTKKCKGLFCLGEYERPVKDGKFSLPPHFRQFINGDVIAFRKNSDFSFLSLFPRTFEKSLARHKPETIKHVSFGVSGIVNLGQDVCQKVFNKHDFDAVIFGAINAIQVWDKKVYSNWSNTHGAEVLRIVEIVNDKRC